MSKRTTVLFTSAGVIAGIVLGAGASSLLAQSTEQPCQASLSGRVVTVDLDTCEPLPTTTTVDPGTTTTASPATSSTTSEPTTTAAPATTTTTPATTTPATSTSTTSTTLTPTTTSTSPPTSQAAFSENFSTGPSALGRFDFGNSGGWFVADVDPVLGDHDVAMCGNPDTSPKRQLTNPSDRSDQFYVCAPGGDATKAHLMTATNTHGYQVLWFSPRQVFTDVQRVCWAQNLNFLSNGKWLEVNFLTPAEYGHLVDGKLDLGFTTPGFPNNGGPSSEQGTSLHGVNVNVGEDGAGHREVSMKTWNNGRWNENERATGFGADDPSAAPRHRICVENVGTSQLRLTVRGQSVTVQGHIPAGPIRVVWGDDNYDPDKHHTSVGGQSIPTNSGTAYTWHWDDIEVD